MGDETDDDFESSNDDTEQSASGSSQVEVTMDCSLFEKNREREQLQQQIEEFLARGGRINHVDANICADPPRKPSNSYGSRPI